jgi:ankyrin repeat protein
VTAEIEHAVKEGDLEKLGALLIDQPEFVSSRNEKHGRTPLHLAAGFRQRAVAELLLAHGADVNAKDNDGGTPLSSAGSKDVTELLLAHGADVNAKDNDGWTPLHRASSASSRREVVESLMAHGADVNAANNKGQTALHMAAIGCNKETVELLLAHGADANARAKSGATPLQFARGMSHDPGHKDVVELLTKAGAETPLETLMKRTKLAMEAKGTQGPKMQPRFRIVQNDLGLLTGRGGLLAVRFECGKCGKTVQVPVSEIMQSGAYVKCHSCNDITYVPPNAGKE